MDGIAGKIVLVVGGATGIGAQIARRLADEGSTAVIADVNLNAAREVAGELSPGSADSLAIACDLSREASVAACVEAVARGLGRIDLLANAVAEMRSQYHQADSNAVDIDVAVWDRILAVDLRGYLLVLKHVIPVMAGRGGGAIVHISSEAATLGEPLRPAYAASKAGINALTRHVAARWGRAHVRCNAVAPGLIDTASARRSAEGTARAGFAPASWDERAAAHPSGRLGLPADIAAAAAFLLSAEAGWINGQVLAVNGGAQFHQ